MLMTFYYTSMIKSIAHLTENNRSKINPSIFLELKNYVSSYEKSKLLGNDLKPKHSTLLCYKRKYFHLWMTTV